MRLCNLYFIIINSSDVERDNWSGSESNHHNTEVILVSSLSSA